jgi:hypothetical protein
MAILLLYYCFNGCNNSRNISDSTPRSDKKLHAVIHCAESRLRAMHHCGESTPHCESLRGVATTICKNCLAC